MTRVTFSWFMILSLLLLLLLLPFQIDADLNVIDGCWRKDRNWDRDRHRLALCSVGFAGKMTNNMGRGVRTYTVTDPGDDPINPRPGTLRHGAAIQGKVWIKFKKNMQISLKMPLLVSSYTAIDGRGVDVQIAHGACIWIHEVWDVIIHGLNIHHCWSSNPGDVIGPQGKVINIGRFDADAIAIRSSSKVWIDHNTFFECPDGLIDVTLGSRLITISNNWFKNQDKVMLLGHDDGFGEDKNMKVTVAFNHFGPNCVQRMPRVRNGYAHIVNNHYEQWRDYAIGGSSNPTIRSEGNLFEASAHGGKSITWRSDGGQQSWNWKSVEDIFKNGAYFLRTGPGGNEPRYTPEQKFTFAHPSKVRSLTKAAGALHCVSGSPCRT